MFLLVIFFPCYYGNNCCRGVDYCFNTWYYVLVSGFRINLGWLKIFSSSVLIRIRIGNFYCSQLSKALYKSLPFWLLFLIFVWQMCYQFDQIWNIFILLSSFAACNPTFFYLWHSGFADGSRVNSFAWNLRLGLSSVWFQLMLSLVQMD